MMRLQEIASCAVRMAVASAVFVTGVSAQPGGALIITKVKWNGPGEDAIEIFNPTDHVIDFSGWYFGSNDGPEVIGVPGNAWSILGPLEKRVLRRGEPGAFSADLDYLTVAYLLTPDFERVEQLGWSRPDGQQPEMCIARVPDTGGYHDGFDWFTSGGDVNLYAGQLQYVECPPEMLGPVTGGPIGSPAGPRAMQVSPNPARPTDQVHILLAGSGGLGALNAVMVHDVLGRVIATIRLSGESGPAVITLPVGQLTGWKRGVGRLFITAVGEEGKETIAVTVLK